MGVVYVMAEKFDMLTTSRWWARTPRTAVNAGFIYNLEKSRVRAPHRDVSLYELPAGGINLQFRGQCFSGEQTGKADESELFAEIAERCLKTLVPRKEYWKVFAAGSSSAKRKASEQRQLPVDEGFTPKNRVNKKVKKGKVKNWACVSFSCMGDEELRRFLYKLSKMCVAIGMAFYPHPAMFIHSKSAKPEDIEETLCHVYSLFTKLEMEEDEEGLIIIILPEDECSHVKVKDVCENHGVIYKCCLPVHARRSSRQYLMKTACEINKAVQRDKVTEADGPEQSGDSDAETVYRHSHNKSGENDFVGSDEESEEVDSSDKESKEDEGPEQPEGSDEFTSEDDGSELPDGVETREHDGFEDEGPGQLKQMGKYVAESSNRKCVHHVDVQVEEVKGKVKNWACVSFSHSCRKETFRFLDKLKDTCVAIGMDFFPMPTRFIQVKFPSVTDIEHTLWGMDAQLSQIFRETGVEGNQIGLLVVILPDQESYHVIVEDVCEGLGIVYQCCFCKDGMPSKEYLKSAAHEINRKVLQREAGTQKPFLCPGIRYISEAPTIIFGANISCSAPSDGSICIASVLASTDWPQVDKYKALVSYQPDNEFVKDLFSPENGGMVSELLVSFRQNKKQLPERIYFFRNGAIEGQFNTYLLEIDAVIRACASLEEGYRPRLTFMVVDQYGRPPVPEVFDTVDEDIYHGMKHGVMYQFACSCSVYGCSCAERSQFSYYYVLHDDNCFKVDDLRSLCINICTPVFVGPTQKHLWPRQLTSLT